MVNVKHLIEKIELVNGIGKNSGKPWTSLKITLIDGKEKQFFDGEITANLELLALKKDLEKGK